MAPEIYQLLAGSATAAFSAFIGWLVGRRKQNAEAVISEMEAVERAVTIWRQTAEQLRDEVHRLRADVTAMSEKINQLHQDNVQLRAELSRPRNTNSR